MPFKDFWSYLKPPMLGLAFVHVWIYCTLHRYLDTGGVSLSSVLYTAMSAGLLALIAALWLGAANGNDVAHARRTLLDTVAALAMAAGGVLLSLPLPSVSPGVAAAVGAGIGGLGVTLAYGRWIQVYAMLDLRFAAPLIFVTTIAGSILKTIVDLLPPVPAAVVFAIVPFAAFWCARASQQLVPSGPQPERYYTNRTVGSLGRVLCAIVVFCFTMGIVQATYLESRPDPYVASVLLNHGTEIAISVILTVWVCMLRRGLDFARTWRLLLILMVTALIFEMPLEDPAVHAMLFSLVRTAHAILIVYFLFLAVADVARHSPYNPLAVYAVGWLAYVGPFAIGNVVGTFVATSPLAPFVPAIAAWTLVVAVQLLVDDRSLGNRLIFADINVELDDEESPLRRISAIQREEESKDAEVAAAIIEEGSAASKDGAPSGANAMRSRCQSIARTYNLTSREAEVFELLVRGHSKTRIAETFLISENTVRGHVKHIYEKLGVHTKQELLDLYEQ